MAVGHIYNKPLVLKPYSPKKASTRYVPKIIKHEEGIQKRVASYLRQHYPHVNFMSDYAAGLKLTEHQASVRKSLQSGRGWPDMFIAWPMEILEKDGVTTRHCSGLFLELKREETTIYVTRGPRKGLLSKSEQIQIEAAMLSNLNKVGYCAVFAVGYDKSIRLIEWYMSGGRTNAELELEF